MKSFYASFLKLIVKADAKMFSSCDLKSCKWAPNMVWEPVLGMLSHVSRKGFSSTVCIKILRIFNGSEATLKIFSSVTFCS